jgi:hypothetical protein
MIDTGAGLRVRRRLLLVLLVCIALPLVGGCSFDPECIAVPFLPQCFEDDEEKTDEEEKTDDTATQTRVRVHARADAIDTTMVTLRHTLDKTGPSRVRAVTEQKNNDPLELIVFTEL